MKKILFSLLILNFVLAGCFLKKSPAVNDASKKQEDRQAEKNINKQQEGEKQEIDEVEENKTEQKNEIVKRASELKLINDIWNSYTNYNLGFSINIPKEDKYEGKFQTVEDGDIVYIVTDESYKYLKIEEKLLSAESDFKKIQGLSLVAIVKKVNNDIELEQFIKDKYGKKCKLGVKNQSAAQEDIFDISIDSSGWDVKNTPEPWTKENSCFVNYGTFIKYNPKNNLVASWDRGQAVNYLLKDGTAADSLISNSFKFINTDETADWKTYRNEEFGFEFQHPNSIIFISEKVENFKENTRILLQVNGGEEWQNRPFPLLGIYIWTKEVFNRLLSNPDSYTATQLKEGMAKTIENNNKIYELSIGFQDGPAQVTNFIYTDNYKKLLSTFKFIN